MTTDPTPEADRRWRPKPSLVVLVLLIVLGAGWWLSRNVLCGFSLADHRYTVPSEAMAPTIDPGSRIRVVSDSSIERGDVVVHEAPTEMRGGAVTKLVKRVVAVGGDKIEVRDNHLYVNGAPVEEPYVNPECAGVADGLQAMIVPDQHVYVLGDNRCHSADSRFHGPIPLASIVGRVCGEDLD